MTRWGGGGDEAVRRWGGVATTSLIFYFDCFVPFGSWFFITRSVCSYVFWFFLDFKMSLFLVMSFGFLDFFKWFRGYVFRFLDLLFCLFLIGFCLLFPTAFWLFYFFILSCTCARVISKMFSASKKRVRRWCTARAICKREWFVSVNHL